MRFFPAPAENVLRRIVVTTALFATPIIFTACGSPGSQIGPKPAVAPTVDQVAAPSGTSSARLVQALPRLVQALPRLVQALDRRVQALGPLLQSFSRLFLFLTGQAPTMTLRPSNPYLIRSSSRMPRRTRVNSML